MTRTRMSLTALCFAACLMGSVPAHASGEPLVSGRLTDASGQPISGTVRVHAWPRAASADMPVVGLGTADSEGNFTANVTDAARLRALAAAQDGWMDFVALGESGTTLGQWTFTSHIKADDARLRSVRAEDTTSTGVARAATRARPPHITIGLRPSRLGARMARAPEMGGRCNSREIQKKSVEHQLKLAIVGELNNAYNDGTTAEFTYGQERRSETRFGVAVSADGGSTFAIGGETDLVVEGEVVFPVVRRRYARKLRSQFRFTREVLRLTPCSAWETHIRVTDWMGGTDDSIKQARALDRCDPRIRGTYSGGKLRRNSGFATRWTRGAEAFGVYLTATSGFTENVQVKYHYRGPARKQHYACGPDGRESPNVAGRIFSGAQR